MIEITVSKADTHAANFETLTTGMLNAVLVHFTLSEHWDGLTKIAVFSNGIRSVTVPEANWADNSCAVPSEVLQEPWRTVRCGVYGMRGDQLILPAVMAGIGRVKPGTDPNADPGTDPDLPIWAQLENRVTDLERSAAELTEKSCFTEIVKNFYIRGVNEIADGDELVRVYLNGLSSLEGCPELWVYRCIRRRDRRNQWRHPGNWNANAGTGDTKLGYGLIVGKHYGADESAPVYPAPPEWMPNNGFLTTVFPIDAATLTRGYLEIDLRQWVLPLIKPVDANLLWKQCGFVGLQKDSVKAPWFVNA